jgi:hypothetical protein
MHMRRPAALAALTAVASVGLVGVNAPAQAADTTTTFTITAAGGLSISAPASANLGSVSSGATTVSGSLGTVTVTDQRGLILGNWTATASSTNFAHGSNSSYDISKASAVYATGAVSGDGGASVGVGGSLALPVVAAARVGAGNNTVSWNPTVTVALSPTAVVGTYTATITHSVS